MITTLMIFQVVITLLLIVLVLLQFGKGAEAGLFSGGGESLMTGAQQGNFLSKATVVISVLFMANCILLSKLQADKAGTSLLDDETPVARPLNSDAPLGTTTPTTEETKTEAAPETKTEAEETK
jgi:preprotein translocase subunit SecG